MLSCVSGLGIGMPKQHIPAASDMGDRSIEHCHSVNLLVVLTALKDCKMSFGSSSVQQEQR